MKGCERMYFKDKQVGDRKYKIDLRRSGENSELLAMYDGYVSNDGYMMKLYLKKLALGTRYGTVPGKITIPIYEIRHYRERIAII